MIFLGFLGHPRCGLSWLTTTFRNSLSVPSSKVNCNVIVIITIDLEDGTDRVPKRRTRLRILMFWKLYLLILFLLQHSQQTSMPPAEFEPVIPASDRPLWSAYGLLTLRAYLTTYVKITTFCYAHSSGPDAALSLFLSKYHRARCSGETRSM